MINRQGIKCKLGAAAATIAAFAVFAPAALAAAGDPDPGFAGGALATLAPGGAETVVSDVAAQPDGKLVVAGLTREPDPAGGEQTVGVVARYEANGSLDPSFGSGGVRTIGLGGTHICLPVSNWNCPAYVVVRDTGRILVALNGAHGGGHGASSALLVRLTPDGQFDQSFGPGTGQVLIPRFAARGLAAAVRGRIVVGGISRGRSVAARYLPSGRPDARFGANGEARVGSRNYLVHDVAVDAHDRIVAGGELPAANGRRYRIAAARLSTTGGRDRSFSRNGMTTVKLWGHVHDAGANGVAVDRAGRVVLAGYGDTRRAIRVGRKHRSVGAPKFAVARLRKDGRLDRSFASDGHATTWFGRGLPDPGGVDGILGARSVVADGNELYVAGGAGRDFAAGVIALAAYRPDGRLDSRFGAGGKVRTAPPAGSPRDCAVGNSAALVPNGRLAVGGYEYGCDEEEAGYAGPPDAGAVAVYGR